jgi:ATP adenylyltransferase
MQTLFTPWRYSYIRSAGSPPGECFLCAAGANPEDPERLVLLTTEHHVVLLNKHPYNNGHLMIAPRQHRASPGEMEPAAQAELWSLVLRCQRAVEQTYRPHGLNLGLNLGVAAGAGVPDHWHLHLVPRWSGDTNFLSVVGDVRLIPEDLGTTLQRLRAALVASADHALEENASA